MVLLHDIQMIDNVLSDETFEYVGSEEVFDYMKAEKEQELANLRGEGGNGTR